VGKRRDEAEARARLAERAAIARDQLHNALSRIDPDFTRIWTDVLDASYWLAFGKDDRFRHAAFARAAFERGQATSVGVRTDKRRSATEVMVLTPDRHGLFADIAGALSKQGANVVGRK
jgi:[protein-PII] uridylyltransferase